MKKKGIVYDSKTKNKEQQCKKKINEEVRQQKNEDLRKVYDNWQHKKNNK